MNLITLLHRLARTDWLTTAAWLLTLGCLGCAILDSYTSLCVVGGSLGHIGSPAACPDVGGWDTRVFPLAVDMSWGGALATVLRLARSVGFRSWRWWLVLVFELVTAAFTLAGNALHGLIDIGAAARLSGAGLVAVICVASAVPGVVAVGSGFTLSVLIATRDAGATLTSQPAPIGTGGMSEVPPAPARRPKLLSDRHGRALRAWRAARRAGRAMAAKEVSASARVPGVPDVSLRTAGRWLAEWESRPLAVVTPTGAGSAAADAND
jgi:hypothetical protein